jgi:hypothetical protein
MCSRMLKSRSAGMKVSLRVTRRQPRRVSCSAGKQAGRQGREGREGGREEVRQAGEGGREEVRQAGDTTVTKSGRGGSQSVRQCRQAGRQAVSEPRRCPNILVFMTTAAYLSMITVPKP